MEVDEQYHELLEEYTKNVHEAETLSFIARATELQIERIESLETYLADLGETKERFKDDSNEYGANLVLALQLLVSALRSELVMWVLLKNEEPEEAWDALVKAQTQAAAAIRSHEVGRLAQRRASLYEVIEKVVFPPQMFQSPGYVVKYRECSICSESYDECDHVAGLPSMGELCAIVVKEADLLEISIVESPRDKRCRVTEFADHGYYRNKMTWRLDRSRAAKDRSIKGIAVKYD